MIARCARCQGTFSTDHFGLQTCPHCGAELMLADPNAPAPGAPGAGAPAAPPQPPPPPASPPPASAGEPPPASPPPGGQAQPAPGWMPPPGWAPAPPGPMGPELPSPFADRARAGLFAGFFETLKLVATQPALFFRRVRIDQTGSAVLFGVIAATVGNAAAAVYAYVSRHQTMIALEELTQSMSEEQARLIRTYLHGLSGTGTVAQIVLSPLFALIGIYVGAAIVHLLLMLFRGANRGFDATLTAVAYASGLNLLLAVPACGWFLATIWGVVSLVIGLGEVQRCGTGKAAAAVLSPAVLACLIACCAVAGLGVPAALKQMQDATHGVRETTL